MKNDLTMIKLDRPRFVRFGHKALKTLSALTGKSLQELDFENFDLDDVEKILYCGLLSDAKANGEVLKLEDMEDLLDQAESYQEIINAMGEAISKAFGNNSDKEKN
jgi:hypothetical protein